MSTLVEAIKETYCEKCHLATPAWKLKCIHCGQPLSGNPGGTEFRSTRQNVASTKGGSRNLLNAIT